MVDIHCHILPGVDDGAQTIEESLHMLRKAESVGVKIVVASVHFLRGSYETESSERRRMTDELQKAADDKGIQVQVKPGVEYYLAPQILEDISNLEEFTINNNRKYMLVELPMNTVPPSIVDIFFSMKVKGITPILAHPERNSTICRNPQTIFALVEKGCLMQINAGSILGHFGGESKKMARYLITNGLAHVVGSDMHSSDSVTLNKAVPPIEKLLGREQALRMFIDTPQQIVDGEELHQLPLPSQTPETQPKGWRRFFSRSNTQD